VVLSKIERGFLRTPFDWNRDVARQSFCGHIARLLTRDDGLMSSARLPSSANLTMNGMGVGYDGTELNLDFSSKMREILNASDRRCRRTSQRPRGENVPAEARAAASRGAS
jgi:hypothetical protein